MISSGLIGRSGPRVIEPQMHEAKEGVRFVQGANEQNLLIQDRTVGWARMNLSHALNLSPIAIALLDGKPVGEDHILETGSVLEFLVTNGRKGLGEVFSPESLIERMKITRDDFEDMVASGLPVHRMRDGSLRISETQLDWFLDHRVGQGGVSEDNLLGPSTPPGAVPSPSVHRGDGLYTKQEAARILRVSERTINRWAASGALKVIKKGRVFLVDRVEIERFMRKNTC
jgi:excisionase family DNA binding protein